MNVEADPDAVVAATVRCPGVAGMAAGPGVQTATYLPGRRVPGIRITDESVEVHIVALWGMPLLNVADDVRDAVAPLVGDRDVSVHVDDIEGGPGAALDV